MLFSDSSMWRVQVKRASLRLSVTYMESFLLVRPWSFARSADHTHLHFVATVMYLQTKRSAGWLAGKMHQEGHAVALVTGESTIDQRIAVLNRSLPPHYCTVAESH